VRSSYGFGTDAGLLDRYGWFQDNCGNRMHSPMALRPGHRGLFDMHGNALEWVHDWDGEFGRPGATDPLGAVEGSARVIRGGSFASPSVLCRPAVRRRLAPSLRDSILGFRLALSFVGVPAESGQDKKK
jgi:formylglycine-generating enzyme required for sulfatase activity